MNHYDIAAGRAAAEILKMPEGLNSSDQRAFMTAAIRKEIVKVTQIMFVGKPIDKLPKPQP